MSTGGCRSPITPSPSPRMDVPRGVHLQGHQCEKGGRELGVAVAGHQLHRDAQRRQDSGSPHFPGASTCPLPFIWTSKGGTVTPGHAWDTGRGADTQGLASLTAVGAARGGACGRRGRHHTCAPELSQLQPARPPHHTRPPRLHKSRCQRATALPPSLPLPPFSLPLRLDGSF